MANQSVPVAPLTALCKNFKDYLANRLKVANYGYFVGATTFSVDQLQRMIDDAKATANPVYLRVYYGCDSSGENQGLFIAPLDGNKNVIQKSDNTVPVLTPEPAAAPPKAFAPAGNPVESDIAAADKCPPGCGNDSIIGGLVTD